MSQPFLFGGLLGVCDSTHIRNCNAQGEINVSDSSYDIYVGGLISYYFTDRQVVTNIKDSQANVVITSNSCKIGGFIADLEVAPNTSLEISNGSVHGNISGSTVGGFIYMCYSYGSSLIEKCYVENEIRVHSGASGFINRGSAITIKNCYSLSKIETYSQDVGYAWGFAYSVSHISFINCYSSGSVSSGRGGGFAWSLSNCCIDRCYSDSKIETTRVSAAFVMALIDSEMVNCYSQNNFIKEPTINNNTAKLSVVYTVRNSKLRNFYYSGNAIEEVVFSNTNSEILNFHCLKSDKMTSNSGDNGVTIYENADDMYSIADMLNYGLSENLLVNQDNDFPRIKIA